MSQVSVILPIYNVSAYLRQCLDSVVNQTLTDLWKMGLFRKDTIQESILILESLHLDGKEKLIEGLKKLQQNSSDNTEVVGG